MTTISSAALSRYKKNYQKRGEPDPHQVVFASVQERVKPARVLYPGCHRHLTASLFFPSVDYVDSYKPVQDVFEDEETRKWVIENHQCENEPTWTFAPLDYESLPPEKYQANQYDLLISLSAGTVSKKCVKYLKDGGYVLVNDSHADSFFCFLNSDLKLKAVYLDGADGAWTTDGLDDYFKTTEDKAITGGQAEEAVRIGVVAKRSWKSKQTARFYLFQKGGGDRKRKLEEDS